MDTTPVSPGQMMALQARSRLRERDAIALQTFLDMDDQQRITLAEEVKRSLGPHLSKKEFQGYTLADFCLLGIHRRQMYGVATLS